MGLNFTKSQALALFYQRTLLDAGQLDTRYYTESELNAGQLDTRYYTESEVDSLITGIDSGIGTGDVFVGRDLYVTGDCYIGDAINVTGDMSIQGQLDMGVSGSTAGVIEIHEGSSVPPYIILNDKTGSKHYLNVGSSNVLRFGINDPSASEDINNPLQTSSSGLAVDGSNWMTGRFMSSDTRLTSRANVIANVDDEFDNSSIDSSLWTERGTPAESTYLALSGGGEGLVSKYWLEGDFDIRISVKDMGSTLSTHYMQLRATFSTTADALSFNINNAANQVLIQGRNNIAQSWCNGLSMNATGGSTNPDGASGYWAMRLTRVGSLFTTYLAYGQVAEHDITDDDIWTSIHDKSFSPSRSYAQIGLGIRVGNACKVYGYRMDSGTVLAGDPEGPAWKVDLLAALPGEDPMVQFFNSQASGTEVATLFGDGSLGLVGDLDTTGDIYIGGDIYGLKRQIGWYFDGADGDNTGDPVAWQVLAYGDGPYSLIDALVDYQVVTTGEATWDIEYCTQANMEAGTLSWTSIFTTAMTVDAGEYTSDSAATAKVLDSINLPEKARVRAKVTTPSGGEDATVSLVFKSGAS